MADAPHYGASAGDWRDAIRRTEEMGQANDQLRDKEQQRQSTEERGQSIDRRSTTERQSMGDATATLTERLNANRAAVEAETAALTANVAIMREAVALRREMGQLPIISVAERATAQRVASGGSSPLTNAPIVADPQAQTRLAEAERRVARAEIAANSARADVRTASRASGATAEDVAPLVQRRQVANQELQSARGSLRATQTSADLQAQISVAEQQRLDALRQLNQLTERQATSLAVSGTQAASVIEQTGGVAAGRTVLPTSRGPIALLPQTTQSSFARVEGRLTEQGQFISRGGPVVASSPQHYETDASGKLTSMGAQQRAYDEEVSRAGAGLSGLSAEQARANQAFQAASASYADASNALSRHGALTTEFIQALSRGEVTLQEFGSQVTATIGKFGGWAIAAAAVYGVYDALKHVYDGARDTQGAVQNLGRFIPGLGGPAGGGTGQVAAAESTVRNISTQFNVPISEVGDAMQVMARTFHSVSDAGDATRAALAAYRLDQVPLPQSEQYLVGLVNTLPRPQGMAGGAMAINVVDQLNQLQATYGVRVLQSLPGLARAAPAAVASGVSTPELEAMVGLGVRAGVTGNQIGTALVRSMTNFAFRPGSATIFGQYGIEPRPGQYGDLMGQVMSKIDRDVRGGTLTGSTLRNLATGLGGPQLGGRSIMPLLEQEALNPGFYQRMVASAQHPRPYQQDLDRVLGSVSERFKSIGISLQGFGSEMGSVTLTPIIGLLDVTHRLLSVFETLLGPLSAASHVFAELPGPVRDLLAVLVAMRVGRAFMDSRFGGTAQSFVGRLPGLSAFGPSNDRQIVDDAVARMRTYVMPSQQAGAERALGRYRGATENTQFAANQLAALRSENPQFALAAQRFAENPEDPQRAVYEQNPAYLAFNEELVNRTQVHAQARAEEERYLQQSTARRAAYETTRDVDLPIMQGQGPGKGMSYAQRAQYAQNIGMVAQEQDNAAVDALKNQRLALLDATRRGVTVQTELNTVQQRAVEMGAAPGGGRGFAAAAAGASAADVGAITAVSMRAVAQNQSGIDDIVQGVGQSQGMRAMAERQQAASRPPINSFADLGQAAGLAMTDVQRRISDRWGGMTENMVGYGGMNLPTAGYIGERAMAGIRGAMSSPMAPFAGIMAAQMASQAVGQNNRFGQYLGGEVTSGLTGMMMMQMLGKGPMGMGLGYLAGNAMGAIQSGNAGQMIGTGAGALIGGGIGAALGTLTDLFTFGTGTFIGAGLGSTVGGFVGSLFGGGNSSSTQADHASQAMRTAQKAVAAERNLDPHGGFLSQFTNALTLGGSAGSNAQTQASAQLQQLSAEMLIFGPTSTQGRQASSLATSAIMSTLQSARYNPAAAQQLLSAADQTRQTAVQNQLKYSLQTGPPGTEFQSADTAAASYRAQMAPYQGAVTSAKTDLDSANAQLAEAQAAFNKSQSDQNRKRVTQQKQAVADAQSQLSAAQGIAQQEQQTRDLNIQQAYQQAYQFTTQYAQAQGNLAQAQAGGDVTGQARAQVSTARQLMDAADKLAPHDPHTAAVDRANAQAQLLQAQQRIAAQGLTELQSRGGVSEAQVFTGDPIGQARVNLQNLRDQYKYMKDHAKAFDPSQLRQAYAGVITAEQQLAQTISDYHTQMIGLRGQIQQADEYGNAVAQAATGLSTGYQQLAAARTPAQRAQAQLQIAQAQAQGFQAQQQSITAQGQLAEALASGNPVRQAQLALQYAGQLRATAHGIDNQRAAEAQYAQAQYAYQQALEQRQVDLGNLAASTTLDPVQQLRDQMLGIARALSIASRPQDRIQLRTQLNTTRHQMESTLIDTREQTINFQFQMMEISSQQAVNQLQGLLRLQGLTRAKRQEIMQQIRQYQLGLVSPIGSSGQFDLAPGNIRLPTFYDVQHALRGGRAAANATNMAVMNNEPTIIVHVHRAQDAPKVYDQIDRATGGHLRQRMRAAGVR